MSLPEIKGWRERAGLSPEFKLFYPTAVEQAMLDEIAELRARLDPPDPKPKEKDPRQLDIMDVIEPPKFGAGKRACDCKPGKCKTPDARECADWAKRSKKSIKQGGI